MRPTNEQEIAIQTQDRAMVVEAGAGTGKTWVLVQRFMRLLQDYPEWPLESICAVTFTEKAAREMRTRIRKAIEEKAAEVERQPTAGKGQSIWQAHRLNLDRMRISTIHSLCSRILRENAIACGIDPHFKVLDEQEADLLKEEAVRKTLRVMDDTDHPALALLASLRVFDLRVEMDRMLDKRGTLHKLFQDLGNEQELLGNWKDGIGEMRESLWSAQLRNNLDLVDYLGWLPTITIENSEDILADHVILAQEGCKELREGNLLGALKNWLQIRLIGGRKDNWGGTENLGVLKNALRTLREEASVLEKRGALFEVGVSDHEAAGHLQLWKSLWETLEFEYKRLKDHQQALDFDDLEILSERLLQGASHGKRLKGFLRGINHLMVDEFQDTNPIQQRIVYALAPPVQEGKLFVVGDAKQSIYRFRQAQVSIFNQTAKDIEKITGHAASPLSTSFRSHNSLVNAVNELFNVILAPADENPVAFEAVPGPLLASRTEHPQLSCPVEIMLLPAREPEGDGKLSMEEARIWEAGWIGKRLSSLKEDRFLVWDKNIRDYRPFEYKDAAILFRATTVVPLYESVFKDMGLPYLTISGRGYYDRPEVQDLISLLAALANPSDDLSLGAALRSPLFSLSDETLFRLRWHKPGEAVSKEPNPFQHALRQPPVTDQVDMVGRAAAILEMLWVETNRVEVVQLLRIALDATIYETTLAISDGDTGRQLSNVDKFMALAREWSSVSPAEFLRRLRDLQTREAREGEALGWEPESGAVQLMSIHAAKGLEFPVVVLADLGRGKKTSLGSQYLLHDPSFGIVCKVRDETGDWMIPAGYHWGKWLHDSMEEAESKRLMYVACTRAADLLLLSGKAGGKNTWMTEFLDAWSISPEGPNEEILAYKDYSIKISRPDAMLDHKKLDLQEELKPPVDFSYVPKQAFPLPGELFQGPVSVTHLAQSLAKDDSLPADFRPAIWESEIAGRTSVPGRLVGRIVHKVLALWEPLSYGDLSLKDLLEALAVQEGIALNNLQQAAKQVSVIMYNFRKHPIYESINQAELRYHELPFTLETKRGLVYGVIDLLYQDASGEWQLVDWKTEWTRSSKVERVAREYHVQMACHTLAVERILGVRPAVRMWFLRPDIQSYRYTESELNTVADKHGLIPSDIHFNP